ncbi:hypothetical protein PV433_18395 [Paenibacillus sp. GYB004]|uniref:hypothetical protein n=1 Tax=Paenibacillus sp. GYB004 TaxID=2994393 RepID=UPI002F961CDA
MEEVKWFMNILGTRDYAPISRLISGFPQDMRSPGDLKKQIEAALLRGFTKSPSSRRRVKNPQLHIRELYQKVGTDLIEKTPRLEVRGDLNGLILTLAGYPKLKPYQHISLIYILYKDDFDNLLQSITDGAKEGKGILDCFPSSPYDRVHSLLRVEYYFESIIPDLEEHCQRTLSEVPVSFEDIEQLFTRLQAAELHDDRLAIVALYLLENDRYKDDANAKLINYVISRYYSNLHAENSIRVINSMHEVEKLKENVNQLETRLEEANKEVSRLNEQQRAHLEVATSTIGISKDFEKQIQTLINEKNELMGLLQGSQQQLNLFRDFSNYIDVLRGSARFLYICERPQFIASLFGFDSAYTSDVINWGKTKWTKYRGAIVCINRSSFSRSKDWVSLEKTLEKNTIPYFTVSGYDEIGCVQQVITYMMGADIHDDEHVLL